MKIIPSILTAATVLSSLSLAGCEYYNETPRYLSYDGGNHGTEISGPGDETAYPATETGEPEVIAPEVEPTDDAPPAVEEAQESWEDERLVDDEDEAVEARGIFIPSTVTFAPPVVTEVVVTLPPSFSVARSSHTLQLQEKGGLNAGGSCRETPPTGPEVGIALKTSLKQFDGGRPTRLTYVYLGCKKADDWLDPDQTDRAGEWNNSARYDELPENSFAYGGTLPVGHALVGVKLLQCRADDSSIAADFCGISGLFRAVHRDGTIEPNIEEVQIPRQENYIRSPDFEKVIRCAEPDEVVTGLYFRQPDASEDSPVTWVELTCSGIVK